MVCAHVGCCDSSKNKHATAHFHATNHPVVRSLEPSGAYACVEIADSGPGIPEAVQRRIFKPFFTTKGVGEGTGLGLDISQRIVSRRRGGSVRVASKPGDTRFTVRLPLEL